MSQKNPDFEPLCPIYGQNTGFRARVAVGPMPSNLPGGLSRFRAIWGEKSPKKKVSKRVWGYFGGVFMMFPDGFDAFWAPQTPILVSDHLA